MKISLDDPKFQLFLVGLAAAAMAYSVYKSKQAIVTAGPDNSTSQTLSNMSTMGPQIMPLAGAYGAMN